MKRGFEEEKVVVVIDAVEHLNTRLVAQLVAQYGFHCLLDIVTFSRSLDKKFLEWACRHLWCKSAAVASRSCYYEPDCYHRASFGAFVLNLNVLQLLPRRWMHAYHMKFKKCATFGEESWWIQWKRNQTGAGFTWIIHDTRMNITILSF